VVVATSSSSDINDSVEKIDSVDNDSAEILTNSLMTKNSRSMSIVSHRISSMINLPSALETDNNLISASNLETVPLLDYDKSDLKFGFVAFSMKKD